MSILPRSIARTSEAPTVTGDPRSKSLDSFGARSSWLLMAPAVLVALVWIAYGHHGMLTWDEGWFLQVLRRVSGGEVLYRDVYYGTPPLAVYLALPLLGVFGPEVIVVRLLLAACFLCSVWLAIDICRRLGLSREVSAIVVLTTCVYGKPDSWLPPYNAISYLLLMVCLAAFLRWERTEKRGALWIAGAAAGLCGVTKQTIGAYCAIALVTAIVTRRGMRTDATKPAPLVAVFVGLLIAVALVMVPVLISGGVPEFVDYTIGNKTDYIKTANVPYSLGLNDLFRRLSMLPRLSRLEFGLTYWKVIFAMPLVALGLLVSGLALERKHGAGTVLLPFCAASLGGLFPLADEAHLTLVIPLMAIGGAYGWTRLAARLPKRSRAALPIAAVVWLMVGVAFLLLHPVVRYRAGVLTFANLPHCRGILLETQQRALLVETVSRLKSLSRDGVLLLAPYAGLYYVTTGFRNPTPFDYPIGHVFGVRGLKQVKEALLSGAIHSACVDTEHVGYTPSGEASGAAVLAAFISRELKRGPDAGACTLFAGRTN